MSNLTLKNITGISMKYKEAKNCNFSCTVTTFQKNVDKIRLRWINNVYAVALAILVYPILSIDVPYNIIDEAEAG